MSKYSDMFERVRGKPCVLGDLLIDGLQRTDRRVVERELEGLKSAATLDEIKDVLIGATNRLHEMDIFDTVEMRVGAGTEGDDEGTPDTADVTINLHESNILKIHGGSYVNQSGEGSLEATVGVKNSLGWAERFDASFEVGNQKSSTFSLSAAQPRVWGTRGELQAQIFQATTNNQRFCSFTETMRGAQISLHSDDGRHRVRLEGGWQEISDQSRMHSKLMQGQMGHRLRSSVTYTWTHHQVLAEEGVESGLAPLLGLKSETQIGVAPIGGAVGFAKQVLSGMVKLPTGNGSDLTFAAKAGVLLPLGDKTGARPSCISDRFFIGGGGGGGGGPPPPQLQQLRRLTPPRDGVVPELGQQGVLVVVHREGLEVGVRVAEIHSSRVKLMVPIGKHWIHGPDCPNSGRH
mmetsp:Transcript_32776/g.77703  ORF Transcript_32776/g.77703 Transcript_32776/m.77703 type:complete len:405 (-) Transcript_32776:1215-2429(-)